MEVWELITFRECLCMYPKSLGFENLHSTDGYPFTYMHCSLHVVNEIRDHIMPCIFSSGPRPFSTWLESGFRQEYSNHFPFLGAPKHSFLKNNQDPLSISFNMWRNLQSVKCPARSFVYCRGSNFVFRVPLLWNRRWLQLMGSSQVRLSMWPRTIILSSML